MRVSFMFLTHDQLSYNHSSKDEYTDFGVVGII